MIVNERLFKSIQLIVRLSLNLLLHFYRIPTIIYNLYVQFIWHIYLQYSNKKYFINLTYIRNTVSTPLPKLLTSINVISSAKMLTKLVTLNVFVIIKDKIQDCFLLYILCSTDICIWLDISCVLHYISLVVGCCYET